MSADLAEENKKLREEVARLRAELSSLKHSGTAVAAAVKAEESSPQAQSPQHTTTNRNDGAHNQPSTSGRQFNQTNDDYHSGPNGGPGSAAAGFVCPLPQRTFACSHGLSKEQVERYSRHLLLPAFGVQAQAKLCKGSVLIIGCGGLGSPAALYLAAAGVGRLGLVDHDVVDVTNLHRQIIHTSERVGMHKAASARASCAALNPLVQVDTYLDGFKPSNAVQIMEQYDVVVDASDNPATRYLISDACVATGKPLVSAAAVGTDGQLTVYNHGKDGPCYRCLFPESPAPQNCARCGEAGVLGVVPGIMGCLQALEAIKVLGGVGDVLSQRLLIFDALAGRFSAVRLRGKRPGCVACGEAPLITRDSVAGYDYVAFTGQEAGDGPPVPLRLLTPEQRLTPAQLHARLQAQAQAQAQPRPQPQEQVDIRSSEHADSAAGSKPGLVLLDVRPLAQYNVMALPGAVHVPFERFAEQFDSVVRPLCGLPPSAPTSQPEPAGADSEQPPAASSTQHQEPQQAAPGAPRPEVVVLCRRGNNSQLIVRELCRLGVGWAVDLEGGYTAWAQQVDPAMPLL